MYSVAIVEDEKEARDKLASYLERYGNENGFAFDTVQYADAESFLTDFHCQFDIVFMDIEMPCIDGMSAARRLRKADDSVALVFVTNLARYAINGYEVNALDYVLKPLGYEAFSLKIRKILNYCNSVPGQSILLSFRGQYKRLPVSDIYYVEICAHNVIFHTVNGQEQSYGTLKEIKDVLSGKGFSLCNRCYLVNLRHVKGINGYSVTVGDEELQISRLQKTDFSDAFKAFVRDNKGN